MLSKKKITKGSLFQNIAGKYTKKDFWKPKPGPDGNTVLNNDKNEEMKTKFTNSSQNNKEKNSPMNCSSSNNLANNKSIEVKNSNVTKVTNVTNVNRASSNNFSLSPVPALSSSQSYIYSKNTIVRSGTDLTADRSPRLPDSTSIIKILHLLPPLPDASNLDNKFGKKQTSSKGLKNLFSIKSKKHLFNLNNVPIFKINSYRLSNVVMTENSFVKVPASENNASLSGILLDGMNNVDDVQTNFSDKNNDISDMNDYNSDNNNISGDNNNIRDKNNNINDKNNNGICSNEIVFPIDFYKAPINTFSNSSNVTSEISGNSNVINNNYNYNDNESLISNKNYNRISYENYHHIENKSIVHNIENDGIVDNDGIIDILKDIDINNNYLNKKSTNPLEYDDDDDSAYTNTTVNYNEDKSDIISVSDSNYSFSCPNYSVSPNTSATYPNNFASDMNNSASYLNNIQLSNIPDWLSIYYNAPKEFDHKLKWNLFKLPELEDFLRMFTRLFRKQLESVVIKYELYRLSLQREYQRRLLLLYSDLEWQRDDAEINENVVFLQKDVVSAQDEVMCVEKDYGWIL